MTTCLPSVLLALTAPLSVTSKESVLYTSEHSCLNPLFPSLHFLTLHSLYSFIQLFIYPEAVSHVAQAGLKPFVAEDGLKLMIYLALPPKCWAHK